MLWLVQRIFFGPLQERFGGTPTTTEQGPSEHHAVRDISWREILSLVPLAFVALWIGLYPKFFLDRMEPSLTSATAAAQQPVRALFVPFEQRASTEQNVSVEALTRAD